MTPIQKQHAAMTAALVAGYVASVLLSFVLSRAGAQTSTIWTASGFLVGSLILLTRRWRVIAVTTSLCAQVFASFAVGDGWVRAVIGPLGVLFEAGLAAWLAVRYCEVRARRLTLRRLTLLMVGAVVPATIVGSTAGALINMAILRQTFAAGWLLWATNTGLGMAIVLPALLLLVRYEQYKEFRRGWVESAGLVIGVCGVALAVYLQSGLPLHFVIFPTLTLVAFRLGPPGTAVAGFCVATICLVCAVEGHGPGMLVTSMSAAARMRLTEVILATAIFTSLATADAVAEQLRVRRLLIDHDRSARAARRRARLDAQRSTPDRRARAA
ncbi:MAG TPA: MASE1 domain-containing protein [Caulobacteraceae bacterium]|nr:MASE1 domain-containing protein [Caulobacteraceae bacterium]